MAGKREFGVVLFTNRSLTEWRLVARGPLRMCSQIASDLQRMTRTDHTMVALSEQLHLYAEGQATLH